MRVFTVGFTKKTAHRFFEMLRASGAKRVVDVRLNNVSQLAGFSKKDDLEYFLKEICGMEYVHIPALAPTKEIIHDYRNKRGNWRSLRRLLEQLPRKLKKSYEYFGPKNLEQV